MILSNPHTHSDYVDGKSPARDSVEQALKLGFVSLGFSEHAYQPVIDPACGLVKDVRQKYIDEIDALKTEYSPRIRIWTGLEIDRMSPDTGEGLDYFLGANHYLTAPNGDYAGVDGNPDRLEEYVRTYCGSDWIRACGEYFDGLVSCVRAKKPDIVAHFDLIVKYNRHRHWFSEDEAFLRLGRKAMDKIIPLCDLIEVNTGGMARSDQPCPYPVLPLLKYWRSLGGKVIPSSDCHYSPLLDAYFPRAEEYMRQAGYDSYYILGRGDTLFEEVRL